MRHRSLILTVTLLAVLASSCGSATPDQPAADRAVGTESPEWDVDQAILRTVIIEDALDDGLTRTQSGCMIDTTLEAGDFALAELEGIDLTTKTSSTARSALAASLAESLIVCGPGLRDYLNADIPGSSSIPDTHGVESDCLINAYVEAWRVAYTDRFRGATLVTEITAGRIPEIADEIVGMVFGCEAGGAVLLGASNEGNLDASRLSTLEWTCLETRIDTDAFMPAFPFPDEPGDALGRMGPSVQPDVAFCESWVASGGVEPATSEPNS